MAQARGLNVSISSPDRRLEDTYPVYQAVRVLPGMICCQNSSGYLIEAANTSGNRRPCVNVEDDVVDNTDGASADKNCKVMTEGEFVTVLDSTPVIADLDAKVYAVDGDTVTLTAGAGFQIGRIVAIYGVNDPGQRANAVRVKLGSI